MNEMEELFIRYYLIRLKHLVLLLKQTPEGQPLPLLIFEYNTLREFLLECGEYYKEKAEKIVEEYGNDWIKGLK